MARKRSKRAIFEARSAAARKGWATRRRNSAAEYVKGSLRRPEGKNLRRGKPVAYTLFKYGRHFQGERFDFRGLNKAQRGAQLRNILQASTGHRIRVLMMTPSEEMYKRLTTSGGRELERHLMQPRNRPYWFWQPLTLPMESTLETFDYLVNLAPGDPQTKVILVEVL